MDFQWFHDVSQCRGGWDLPFMLGVAGVVPPHLQCKLLPKPSFGGFFWCRSNGVCQLLRKKEGCTRVQHVQQLFLLNTRWYTAPFFCSKVGSCVTHNSCIFYSKWVFPKTVVPPNHPF